MTLTTPVTGKWKVGPYTVEATIGTSDKGDLMFHCEWDPLPRRLSKKQANQYREGRNRFIQRVAEKTGFNFAVVEV